MSNVNRLKKLEDRLAQKPGNPGDAERSPEHEAFIEGRLAAMQLSFEAAADQILSEMGDEFGFDDNGDLSPLAKSKAVEFIESFRRGDGSAALPKPKRRR